MNTLQIDTLLKKHPHSRPVFKGVYARNRLPRLLNVPSTLMGNTDPDHQMGQQWVAIIHQKHPHSRPVFKGVYARNRLPTLLNVPSSLVGNTDPDHRMGLHWVAIYIDANSRGEYYDPTGRPPHESAYVNFMNKHCLHWTYNTV
jgi:hypothetical protein